MTIKDPLASVQAPTSETVNSNGKPARNYKNFVMLLLFAALGGGWLFSTFTTPTEKKAKAPEVEKVNTSIAKELIDAAANLKPNEKKIPEPLGEVKSKEGDGQSSAEALAENDRKRSQQILGSSMDAGIEFTTRSNTGNSTQSRVAAATAERLQGQRDLQNKLLANSDKIVNSTLALGAAKAGDASNVNLSADQAFLAARDKDSFEAPAQIHEKHRGHALYQGHLIRTVLIKGINSDMPGDILARVVSDVFDSVDGRILLIPKGTTIYGAYSPNVVVGQSRLQVATDRMIFPNGKSASLQKSSTSSMTGYAGLNSKVDNHFFQMFGTSLLVGAASWLTPSADQATTSTTGAAGVTTGGSLMAQAIGGAMKDIGSRNKNIKPTLTVGQGEMFLIEIGRDVVLPEYVN